MREISFLPFLLSNLQVQTFYLTVSLESSFLLQYDLSRPESDGILLQKSNFKFPTRNTTNKVSKLTKRSYILYASETSLKHAAEIKYYRKHYDLFKEIRNQVVKEIAKADYCGKLFSTFAPTKSGPTNFSFIEVNNQHISDPHW